MFQQISEKALREILRIVHSVPAAAHETVKRRPIYLAKLRERGLGNFRFCLASAGRQNHGPLSRRKKITLATLVPCQRLHVTSFYQDRKKKSKSREKFRFRAARDPESVCKGKPNYQKEKT